MFHIKSNWQSHNPRRAYPHGQSHPSVQFTDQSLEMQHSCVHVRKIASMSARYGCIAD